MALDDTPAPPQKKDPSKKEKPAPGDIMKAVIRPGEAGVNPKTGDQIILHYTIRTTSGVVVESTRLDLGGTGVPKKYVLGKSKIIKGWEEGIPTMEKKEVAMLKIKPGFHYGDKDFQGIVPDDYPKSEELMFEIELVDFFPVKVVNDDLGVVKRVLEEGEGWETARPPYEVRIWLKWKARMEEDFKPLHGDEPFHFTLGKQEVPEGLEAGISTMSRKEKSIIYVTHNHLTKASLIKELPDDVEELMFEVEMIQIIQVRDLAGDGQVVKRRLRDGRGEFPMDCPLQDSVLRIHYKGFLPDKGGQLFYDSRKEPGGEPVTFGSDEGLVPEGLEMCVKLMLPGELAMVTSSSQYAYDKFPRPDEVPEGANIQWEVELIDFEKNKDWTGLTFQEIMEDAEKIKAIGNRLFKEGKYILAKMKYEKLLREFNHVNPQDEDEGKRFVQMRDLLHLNVAACYQKLDDHVKARESCNKVLEENPNHVKALYRRGMSYMAVGDFDEARTDFNEMIMSDSTAEPDAKAALSKLKRKEQESEKNARRQFKGLFDKKPGELSELNEVENQVEKVNDSSEINQDMTTEINQNMNEHSGNDDGQESVPNLWTKWRQWFMTFPSRRCNII